jgi:hypothetical protein
MIFIIYKEVLLKHNKKIDIPEGFMDDLPEMAGSTVKVYLVLKELADIKKRNEDLETNGTAKIFCGYEYIKKESGVSKPMCRKAILFLSEKGWICGFTRGHKEDGNKTKRTSNEYLIPFERTYNHSEHDKMLHWHTDKFLEELNKRSKNK